ncbi:threonine synthase [Longimycelium tulufanense]|uniref:Threonine synthase n=2 Tax=Longimycelium tulufanense TaxID=907463 RepID=A0A8J3C697_9PSEU|nr:threonine synthase [Longimycelium tulufanense]
MEHFGWVCSRCSATFGLADIRYTCGCCPHGGRLTLALDYQRLGAGHAPGDTVLLDEPSMWRYRRLLPVTESLSTSWVALPVGWTPLYRADKLGKQLGLAELFIKNEALNPTGSLKDRASALVVAKAMELGERTVATASSGNAAAALAGLCAATGLRCLVFVPERTPASKLAQLAAYGATVVRVRGDYDTAVELSLAASAEWGWYCRNTAVNPYTAEGKKTAALEILEQLGWKSPDAVLVPVGDGNILVGLYRGFVDALAMGWINQLPRLIGVQSDAAAALYEAWHRGGTEVVPTRAATVADSISVGNPQDGYRALQAVRDTNGVLTTVPESEIVPTARWFTQQTGVLAEPASAVTVAALPRLLRERHIRRDERMVIVHTGHGLKTLDVVMAGSPRARVVEPTLDALRSFITDHHGGEPAFVPANG